MNRLVIGLGAVAVLLVGTVALASQALPGGPLYGVKLGFNERVEGTLSGQSIDWHIKVAERRLAEASRAALKGRFNSDRQEALLLNFNDHMKAIENHLIMLTEEERFEESKAVAVKLGHALARQVEALTTAQKQVNEGTNTAVQGSLDFLVLRTMSSLAAAANIAAATRIEDEAPEPEIDPSTVDEWGRPI